MDFDEKIALRPMLLMKLSSLSGEPFQAFFQDLMSAVSQDFLDVRTHGNIGDLGADGLQIYGRKLYACYGSASADATAEVRKFRNDLAKAIKKRRGEFDTFVFVSNDWKGTHPELASAIALATVDVPAIAFEYIGFRKIRSMLESLPADSAELVLGSKLPLRYDVTVAFEDIADLLTELSGGFDSGADASEILTVSARKLQYSELDLTTQAEIVDAIKQSAAIDRYFRRRNNPIEKDEVARRFKDEYSAAEDALHEPDLIFHRLLIFVVGSRLPLVKHYRAAMAILAYFFQTCDIFLNPPADWDAPPSIGGS